MILSICLTISGWPFDVKLDIMEAIDGAANHAKTYSWASYLADLVKSNCEKCQEQGTPIRFSSPLIWITMSRMSLVGHPEFTNLLDPQCTTIPVLKLKLRVKGYPTPKKCSPCGYSRLSRLATSGEYHKTSVEFFP